MPVYSLSFLFLYWLKFLISLSLNDLYFTVFCVLLKWSFLPLYPWEKDLIMFALVFQLTRFSNWDYWQYYLECYFEDSKIFSDLNKKAQQGFICNISHGKRQDTGNISDNPRTGPFFILLESSFVLYPFHFSTQFI